MSLLDGLLGDVAKNVLGNLNAGSNPQQSQLLQTAMSLIQQNGGLPGILEKFKQAGFADQVASWVGTGANLPIDAASISKVLSSPEIASVAQKLGMDPSQVSGQLASALPQLINHLTPNGTVPENHGDLLNAGFKALFG